MAKTIIQTIGPLYGEAINGTVFGRPNGSIFVPSTNTITLSGITTIYEFVSGGIDCIGSVDAADIVAQAQDLASAICIKIFEDPELTTLVCQRIFTAGQFNISARNLGFEEEGISLVSEQTYYAVAYLQNRSVDVATSSVLEVVAQ